MSEASKPLRAGRPPGAKSADPAIASAFGKAVVNMRRDANLSQENLALLAGVDRSYMGKLERGQGAPNLAAVVRIAAALGCSAAELVRRFEEVLRSASASEAAMDELGAQAQALQMGYERGTRG